MYFEYETPRLHLRVLNDTPAHASQVLDFFYRNSTVFEKYEPLRSKNFYTEQYHATLLKCEYELFLRSENIRYWIFDKQNPDLIIGTICFYQIIHSIFQSCRLGYKLDRQYWHKGYAKEALSYMIRQVFKELGLHRIEAYVVQENTDSIYLLEALGFQWEGLCRQTARIQDVWTDHLLYALIRRDIEPERV